MSNKLGERKKREQTKNLLESSPNDNWAMVELYRWQYDKLPDDDQPIDISKALDTMALNLMNNDQSKWASPFNIASVLAYVSKILEKNKLNKI